MVTQSRPTRGTFTTPRPIENELDRRTKPVAVWAVIGALFILFACYIWGSWLLSGDAHTVGTGATPVPGWMKFSVRAQEASNMLALALILYFACWRPWRRDGQMAWSGVFALAWATEYWQDPLISYYQQYFQYTSYAVNIGGWAPHIPGWQSPNGKNIPEPLLWDLGAYLVCFALISAYIGKKLMPRAKARWNLSNLAVVAGTFAVLFLSDLILEAIWIRTGVYIYPGGDPNWTLFYGNYYQVPVFEVFLAGLMWTTLACLCYFRNDRGETFAERGIGELRISRGKQTFVRFLALSGMVNVIMLASYNIPIQFASLNSHDWPASIQEKSYYSNGLCGPGTSYACPGKTLNDGVRLDPNGKLVIPQGVTLPTEVPLKK